jgi:activator of Hsp90 ATPase-like protein
MPKTATATVTVTTTRQLKAPPDRVYRAWTDPADVKRWFKPTRLIMNPQVDGLWHSEVEWEGKRWPHYGRFTRLESGGTLITLTHSGLPDDEAENHRKGWEEILATLDELR